MSGDAQYAVGSAGDVVRESAAAASFASYDTAFAWDQASRDAQLLEAGQNHLAAPLWSGQHPEWFRTLDAEMRASWDAVPAFSFWLRWWDGVLSGRQIDWALQEKVALIPTEIWEQGAEAVAKEIARIEEQFRLRREVTRLKGQLAAVHAEVSSLAIRGHNNPPELVEPVAEVERQTDALVRALTEAETELEREKPRPAVLNRVGRLLREISYKSIAYCASLGDAMLKKGAEEIGSAAAKWLVRSGAAAIILQMEEVHTLVRALAAFAKSLGAG